MSNLDWSTINLDRLNKLSVYAKPASYQFQQDPGNCCAGDAPGYPSYFTRSVYTQHGNSPRRGAQMVIVGPDGVAHVIAKDGESSEHTDKVLHSLWLPLPLDHPRVRAWIANTYRHQRHCYYDLSKPSNDRDRTVIFPVPYYNLRQFVDDPRFSDEWRANEQASIAQANAEIIAATKAIATPDNHAAVVIIRKFYQEYQPEQELIDNPPQNIAQWWETEAEAPTPENCHPHSVGPHPVNGNWCQWCGWHQDSDSRG
ncbi:MAG: hypothetical protein KGL39_20760 [Patescibacteria group bacterium]|nr:hypothetical protein [Patescibacteria group bacterium]